MTRKLDDHRMRTGDLAFARIQEAVAQVVPERPALIWRETVVTYTQLTSRSRRLASALICSGASSGHPVINPPRWESGQPHVGILMRNRPEWIEAMFGAFKARAIPFNINFRYTAEELGDVLEQARPTALVYESYYSPLIRAVLPFLNGCVLIEVTDKQDTEIEDALHYERQVQSFVAEDSPEAWTQDDRYILFTGGTTGRPKGVLWRQKDLFTAALGGIDPATGKELDLSEVVANVRPEPHNSVCPPPFMHGAGQWFALTVLFRGGTVVMPTNNETLDPEDVLSTVAEHRARMLMIVGDAYGRPLVNELHARSYDLSTLQVIVTTAVVLSPDVQASLIGALPHIKIVNTAGASESGASLRSSIDKPPRMGQNLTFQGLPGTVLLDDQKSAQLKPDDPSIGWLARHGTVPLGYLGDEARTLQTFPEINGLRYSIPGDRARLRQDGSIELLGRDNLVINSGGEKIFVEEIEQILLRHPDIIDALVSSRQSDRWGQEVVAIVQLSDRHDITIDEIRDFASTWLARYKLPKDVIVVTDIHRSAAGKADYRWAKAMVATSDLQVGPQKRNSRG